MKPPRRRPAAKRKSAGGTLVGLFVGLVIGVLAAAGVVWYINKMPMPFTTKAPPPTAEKPDAAKASRAGDSSPSVPATLPGKPGDKVTQAVPEDDGKPRFDFYKILPGNAEAIPDPKAEPKPAEKAKEAREPKDGKDTKETREKDGLLKDSLFLQAGSFQNPGDADNQKARLALMGAEATIQQVMVQDRVWYRVRIGPFQRMDELNRLRAELARQGVEANIVKRD